MRPIGIDLFSGAGGLSLGFEQAGFDIVAAVDIDPVHCAVHHFNFPNTAVLPRSVDSLSADEIRAAAAIGGRTIDCVFGGAPCQGFSLIGHRALDDPRNGLVRHFVRLVAELRPRTFVFENVKGLTVGRHRAFLEELVAEFEDMGYAVRLPWKVLNAANHGTPQSRERLFVLGARGGVPVPGYPEPTTGIAGRQRNIAGLPDSPTCGDALGDLPDADRHPELLDGDETEPGAWGVHEPPADPLPSRPLRHGAGDGEAPRLPGLVPPARDQVARRPPDRQRRAPPLARAVAAEVAKSLEVTPARPCGTVELGDPGLLKLDISGAAAYFGVDPLPSRRDRKSGAKKRRQVDIEAERLAAAAFHSQGKRLGQGYRRPIHGR